jgi:hypothetical protein
MVGPLVLLMMLAAGRPPGLLAQASASNRAQRSSTREIQRRGLLAAVAALTAGALTRISTPVARADDGDDLVIGEVNKGRATTSLIQYLDGTGNPFVNVSAYQAIGLSADGSIGLVGKGTNPGPNHPNLTPTGVSGEGVIGVRGREGATAIDATPIAAGVHGESRDNVGVRGMSINGNAVYGKSVNAEAIVGSSDGHAAVHGSSVIGFGVVGTIGRYILVTPSAPIGVFGGASDGTGVHGETARGIGVHGRAIDTINGKAGVFDGPVVVNGDLTVTGSLTVNGKKIQAMAAPSGTLMAATPGAGGWIEEFGTLRLIGGVGQAQLPSAFSALNGEYRVFVTPRGDCHGLFVDAADSAGFVIRELQGGRSTIDVDYRVVARQSEGDAAPMSAATV